MCPFARLLLNDRCQQNGDQTYFPASQMKTTVDMTSEKGFIFWNKQLCMLAKRWNNTPIHEQLLRHQFIECSHGRDREKSKIRGINL